MNDQILNKLKKLLTLSKNTSKEEAENALEKATAIAIKNNIDLSVVSIDNQVKESFVQEFYEEGKRKSVVQRYVSSIITGFFNVKLIYTGCRYTGQKIAFIGRKSEVDFALYVQDFLKEHMMNSWQYYKKTHNCATMYRATFLQGFYEGLCCKLETAQQKQKEDSFDNIPDSIREDSINRYTMVLQSEICEREKFAETLYSRIIKSQGTSIKLYNGSAAKVDGFKFGHSTNINKPIGSQLALN